MADSNQKDIDFDELHQAVNALMDKAQKVKVPSRPVSTTDSSSVSSSTPAPRVVEEPKKEVKAESKSENVMVTVKRTLPALTTHRGTRGRAMDVVGPRPRPRIEPPSAQPKRQAAIVQPTREIKPEPITPVPAPLPIEPEKASSREPSDDVLASINMHEEKPAPTMVHEKSEWPDPLDLHGFKDEPGASSSEPDADKEPLDKAPTLQAKSEDEEEPEEKMADKPEDDHTTPFLTTKVEKRPLGAYNTPVDVPVAPQVDALKIEEDPHGEADEVKERPHDKDAPSPLPSQPQPEELSAAVVAVESSEPEFREPTPMPDGDDEDAPDMGHLRNMAIPQQYKDSDKVDDAHARPVFDTKEYHPAIAEHGGAHKHSSSSSVGNWVLAIVLVVLLIVALGMAYFMLTGTLDFSTLFIQ